MYLMINSHYNILYSFKLYFSFFSCCVSTVQVMRLHVTLAKVNKWMHMEVCKDSPLINMWASLDCVFECQNQCLHHLHLHQWDSLEVGFRRFLFLSESNGQTQIVTQILYLHDWSTTLIRFSWLLKKAARVASFAVIVFEFFFNAVYAFLNILNEASLQWE